MPKIRLVHICLLAGILFSANFSFADELLSFLPEGVSVDADARVRPTFWDGNVPAGAPRDSSYFFNVIRVRTGVRYTHDWLSAYVQGQYSQAHDLPPKWNRGLDLHTMQ